MIDVQPLIKEASRLLRNGCATPLRAESQLKKLTLGLKVMQCDLKNVKCFDKIGKAEFLDIIEFYFMAGVKWVSHFDHFQKLDQDLQVCSSTRNFSYFSSGSAVTFPISDEARPVNLEYFYQNSQM